MVITIFGLGFVGLTTSLGFSEYGHKVYGVEVNEERLNTIKAGKLPFLEPGLDEALTRHLNKAGAIVIAAGIEWNSVGHGFSFFNFCKTAKGLSRTGVSSGS